MTDFKTHTEGAVLVISSTENSDNVLTLGEADIINDYDQRIIYDWPAYYYNLLRKSQHYARDFAYRLLGVEYKSPYPEEQMNDA